jgi:hypothetical protein
LPATSAGAAKRITCQKGKFQGITARTAPSGSKRMAPSAAIVPAAISGRRNSAPRSA